jgi:hypothetical protein
MGRWLSVLVPILLWTRIAHADERCACAREPAIFPALGADDVPRNTKIWIVRGWSDTGQLEGGDTPWVGRGEMLGEDRSRVARFAAGPLAAGHEYAFHTEYGPVTQFTTAAEDDTTPPAAPIVRSFAIAVSEYRSGTESVAELALDAVFDPDVVLLRFEFTIAGRTVSRITTVDGWQELGRPACRTELPFRPGDDVPVAVSAIDLAGNESPPTTRMIHVGRAAPTLPACAEPEHVRCGMGAALLPLAVILVILVGGILFLIVLFLQYLRRAWVGRNAASEPISLLAVERLAAAAQRRARVVAAVGVLAAIGVVSGPLRALLELLPFLDSALVILPVVILPTTLVCLGLNGYFAARAMRRVIDPARGEATAEVLGRAVIVHGPAGKAELDVGSRVIAAARLHALPTSIARPIR